MSWTEADGDALFRQQPDPRADDDGDVVFDGGPEAMRRLRFPFETNEAGAADSDPGTPPQEHPRRG